MACPDSEAYVELPQHLHTCVAMSKYFDKHPEIVEFVIYITGLMINSTFYLMIIHRLSNRSVGDESKPDDQATAIRNQVARLLILNGVVFFICHTPAQIAGLNGIMMQNFDMAFFSKTQYDSCKIFGRTFEFMNSSVNVFIYAFSSRFYRHGFRDVFCSRTRKGSAGIKSVSLGTSVSKI